MKRLSAAGLLGCILAGCSSPTGGSDEIAGGEHSKAALALRSDSRQSLRSGEPVDLLVYFPSWNYIGILQPMVKDGNFLHYMRKEEAESKIQGLKTGREIAAVICDFYRPPEKLAQDQQAWIDMLAKAGFHRAVFVQKEPGDPLSEARVLLDQAIR